MPVDPVANRNALDSWFDMNVRRFCFDGVGDDLIDKADERRLIGDVA